MQLAVPDAAAAAEGWTALVGAEHHRDDEVPPLRARRSTYRIGTGFVEFLEPDGAGTLADVVQAREGHLFCGGVSTPDIGPVVARLRSKGMEPVVYRGQAFLHPSVAGDDGVPLVLSADDPQPKTGLVDFLYEVTDLRHDASGWTKRYADLFGLDDKVFVPISSDAYGYEGVLTLFDGDRLDRLEVITPTDPDKTMGRFFAKQGESLYMCFAETGELGEIHRRTIERAAPHTANPQTDADGAPSGMFLHPKAMGGVMLGLSRRTGAWQWSGHPDRVEPLS